MEMHTMSFLFSSYPTRKPKDIDSKEFDYIVIGGGTAGCVLASRLSENLNVTVLLVERGPVVDSWASRVPLLSSDFTGPSAPAYKWPSAPQKALNNKQLTLATGKLLGGTSKINALLYTRSVPAEYDAWNMEGWRWKDVELLYKKSEASLSHGKESYRGTQGMWQNQRMEQPNFDIVKRNISASQKLGIPYEEIANNPSSPALCCSPLDANINGAGYRCSTFDAFLPKRVVQSRHNLVICTETIVTLLDITTNSDTVVVSGIYIEAEGQPGSTLHVSAAREVILCAGPVATPQLLLLSGIGPAEHLASMGIAVKRNLPGVGSHLQDHVSVPVRHKVPISESVEVLMVRPMTAVIHLLKYLVTGKGLFGSQVQYANIMVPSHVLDDSSRIKADSDTNGHDQANIPDIEIMFLPVDPAGRTSNKSFGIFSYLCTLLRPKSAGTLTLTSLNPRDQPCCDLGILTQAEDLLPLRKALRLAHALAKKVVESGYPLQNLSVPTTQNDTDLDSFILENAMTTYHLTSTCRMAPEEDMGVVDAELKVYGVGGLRVADASIFPSVPACHTQAPVVLVAEKCAQMLS